MITDLGLGALFLAFLASVYAGVTAVWGAQKHAPAWVASARNAALLIFPLVLISALAIIYANIANDYSVEFSVNVSSIATPTFLKVTALWGGQNGSLVFWSLLMSAYIFALMWTTLGQDLRRTPQLPWVILACVITEGFFLGLVLFLANPFARLWEMPNGDVLGFVFPPAGALPFVAEDGRGLNPLLRHPGMIIHPPLLYAGFTGFIIPFAFAFAALVTGRTDDDWLRQTRRWTLTAWLFLSLGLMLGGRWAYDVLGWGGYWGWDPVENSSFLPWLTGTAFLHSVMIQEKRGMFRTWNMVLIILTYALVILGTFITRTGIVSSVHAFARSSIGPPFLTFVSLALLVSIGLLVWRWDRLRSRNQLESWLSREAAFLTQNALFLLLTFTVAWGTYFPMISELFTENKLTVGPAWFNQWTGPQFALLLLLMGVAPLIAWRHAAVKSLGRLLWLPFGAAVVCTLATVAFGVQNPLALTGYFVCFFAGLTTLIEYARGAMARARTTEQSLGRALWTLIGRNRRRYGGYMIHLAVVLIALGTISSTFFQQTTQGQLEKGQALSVAGYQLVFENITQTPAQPGDDKETILATVGVFENGTRVATLNPQRDFYTENGESMTPPSMYYGKLGTEDVYVLLVGWETLNSNVATFKVYINPMVNFIWLGAVLFLIGTLVAAWPDASEAPAWSQEWAQVPAAR